MRLTPNTLSEMGKFRLQALAEPDAFVHCADDICLAQELVRDELPRPDSNSECDAAGGNCRDFGHALHVADPPPRRCCIQVVHVVDDFCFQWVPPRSDSGVGDIEILQEGRHQDRVTHNVTVAHVPLICQTSFLAKHAAGCGHR